MTETQTGGGEGCKVDQAAERYGLTDLDDRILRRRTESEASLRDLEEYINKSILRRAMEQSEMTVLDNQEANYYRLLTEDDVISTARKEARRELRENGVDVEQVTNSFVTYQTVKKHLNQCLDTDTSQETNLSIEDANDKVGAMEGRMNTIVNRTVSELVNNDMLDIEDPEVMINIKLQCGQCGRTESLFRLFDTGGCKCQNNDEMGSGTGQETQSRENIIEDGDADVETDADLASFTPRSH